MEVIENKVAKSGLVTLDLSRFVDRTPIYELDISPFLFQGLLLKEKDYREALDHHDWSKYEGGVLVAYCSTDAILAPWAFMLVVQHAQSVVKDTFIGSKDEFIKHRFIEQMNHFDWSQYEGKRVLLKGCSSKLVTPDVYAMATKQLMPLVERLMYGEACSFVPIYRKPKG